jgi:hypothetical protein
MKVTVDLNEIEDKSITEMQHGSVGILTYVPDSDLREISGNPVVRCENEWWFPMTRDCIDDMTEDVEAYYFRPLQPGEKITIEG